MKGARGGAVRKRVYRMDARARGMAETRGRILAAAHRLWLELAYEEVTLERVAERAAVSKQTVLRLFGAKDRLAVAVADWQRPREEAARAVTPGDVQAAVAQLIDRYEEMGDANVRMLDLERRVPAVRHLLVQARESHRQWIERVFAPFLSGRRGAARRRRVMAFYAATDVTLWKLLRRDFELSRAQTEAVMLDLVRGLMPAAGRTSP
jgi:AcrR family transcriptional regulator